MMMIASRLRCRFRATPCFSLPSCHKTLGRSWRLGVCVAAVALVAPYSVARGQEDTAASSPPAVAEAPPSAWKPLFDGTTLKDWQITRFGGQGDVYVEDGAIHLERGSSLTGITYLADAPRCDYELRLEAQRIDGYDFFGTVTFPVKDECCSLVVGGWGGALVGISCLDNRDASENDTTTYHRFEAKKWYGIRIQVRSQSIRAWIDDKQVVDVDTTDRKLSTRVEVSLCEPLGIASFETRAAVRNIAWRALPPEEK